jgi:hypothetical protein
LCGGLEPPDFVVAAGLLATAFGYGVVSTYAALGLPPPAPLDSAVVAVFPVTAFGSSIALGASFVTAAILASFAAAPVMGSLVAATAMASFTAAAAVAAGSSVLAAAAASLTAASGAYLFQMQYTIIITSFM